jgi:hypothetical protein
MKAYQNNLILVTLLFFMAVPAFIFGQGSLPGSWKYLSTDGEMTMQISASTITINNQTFSYKAQGNVLMISEGATLMPYPYMLDGDQLTLEFPGGMEIVFSRITDAIPKLNQLPQSMSKSSGSIEQGQQSSILSGRWMFQNQQGQMILEFLTADQLSFNGETTQYQLKDGVIQAMGDYGWIDYPFTLIKETLTITFPDGTRFPFTRASSAATNQQEIKQPINQQASGGGSAWQLKGALCSWSGSSNNYSSYSRTRKIVFDGQGNFQSGSESSFSSDAGITYGGNPNVEKGTYSVGERTVTMYLLSGETYQLKINMRQDNGMITELMYKETLYAKGLCE